MSMRGLKMPRLHCPDCKRDVGVNAFLSHRRGHLIPWDKVDTSGDCWVWVGPISKSGYGLASHVGERHAHRRFYSRYVGPIPPGYHIDHLCRNRACVRPRHLEAVTPAENMRRGMPWRVTSQEKQTHCKRGHEFTPENIIRRPSAPNTRACRTCNRAQTVAWRRRKTAAA